MGLNPAWRNSLVYTAVGGGWQEGANLTEIDAVRQILIQDMKIVEALAPESGAYFNEVRALYTTPQVLPLTLSLCLALTGITV